MNMDSMNKEIIRQLSNGRKSFDEIAKELSITQNTVRGRVKKLVANGVLDSKVMKRFFRYEGVRDPNFGWK
jgi:Lrp/AsnC family transcriptional regulator for asnA, asnC and gidA